jgi:hypothetical protein
MPANLRKDKMMKCLKKAVRISVVTAALAALLTSGAGSRSLAAPAAKRLAVSNAEKHVQIIVEIHGDIDHHTVDSVAQLVGEWLEAAHFVVSHTDGAGYLHLHVTLNVTSNHHFSVHSDCADWHEDKEAAVVAAIDEILHHVVSDFIDKYSH